MSPYRSLLAALAVGGYLLGPITHTRSDQHTIAAQQQRVTAVGVGDGAIETIVLTSSGMLILFPDLSTAFEAASVFDAATAASVEVDASFAASVVASVVASVAVASVVASVVISVVPSETAIVASSDLPQPVITEKAMTAEIAKVISFFFIS